MDEDEEVKDEDEEDEEADNNDHEDEDEDEDEEDEDEEGQEDEGEDHVIVDEGDDAVVVEDEVGNWGDDEYESYDPLPKERRWKDRPVKGDKRATRLVQSILKRKKSQHNGRLYLPPTPRETSQQHLKKRQRKD